MAKQVWWLANKAQRREAFYLPEPITETRAKNIVGKIRFERAYIELKNEWNEHQRKTFRNKSSSALFVVLVAIIIWVSTSILIGGIEAQGLGIVINLFLASFTVAWVGVCWRVIFNRPFFDDELLGVLAGSCGRTLKSTYIDIVNDKAGVDGDSDESDAIAPNEPIEFAVLTKSTNPRMNNNEILMVGTYVFGRQELSLSVKLRFNKNYTVLSVADTALTPHKRLVA